MLRWLSVLVVAAVIGLGTLSAGDADAQVFRPRGAKGAVIAKAAPAATAAAAPGKKAPAAEATSAKAPAHAAAAAPKHTKKRRAKPHGDSDDVKIDDDDEDVKITDD